jgi:hypothetical protein
MQDDVKILKKILEVVVIPLSLELKEQVNSGDMLTFGAKDVTDEWAKSCTILAYTRRYLDREGHDEGDSGASRNFRQEQGDADGKLQQTAPHVSYHDHTSFGALGEEIPNTDYCTRID